VSGTNGLAGDPGELLGRLTDVPEAELAAQPPGIQCNDRRLDEVTAEALEAVGQANSPPALFQWGDALARVRVDRRTGAPRIEVMGVDAVRGHLARVANWFVVKATRQGTVRTVVPPPLDAVRDLMALPGWPEPIVPTLAGVVECPVFVGDGSLVATPGYDPGTRLWYQPAPGVALPEVPDRPSRQQVARAKKLLLDDLLGDFPFQDEASRTNALALLLLPFLRPLVDGPTPLHLVDAAEAGTGKGLLADVVHLVATGRCAPPSPEGENGGEWRKRVFALLLDDPAFVVIDNVNAYLDSGALAAALTARTIRDRVMGLSRVVEVPVRCVWVATGNNVRMSRELARRTPLVRLVAPCEEPWNRPASDFRHPDLVGFARANRGALVGAALTLGRAWVAAGRPAGGRTVGSYEAWSRALGGAMEVIGRPGFMANAPQMLTFANDDTARWTSFVEQWWEAHGDEKVGVASLFDLVREHRLLEGVLGDGDVQGQRVRLGKHLRKRRDAVFGGLRVAPAGVSRNGSPRYRLVPLRGAAVPPAGRG
jgi:hypothetical protein